jgi:hypothetical protein
MFSHRKCGQAWELRRDSLRKALAAKGKQALFNFWASPPKARFFPIPTRFPAPRWG